MTRPIRKVGFLGRPFSHPPRLGPQRLVKPDDFEDGPDWKTRISPDARQRIVQHVMESLTRKIPGCNPEELHRLWKLAVRFEEKTYSAATSEDDYLRRLASKLLAMEGEAKTNSLPSNSAAHSIKSSDDNKPPDGNKSSDGNKFSAIKEPLRSRL